MAAQVQTNEGPILNWQQLAQKAHVACEELRKELRADQTPTAGHWETALNISYLRFLENLPHQFPQVQHKFKLAHLYYQLDTILEYPQSFAKTMPLIFKDSCKSLIDLLDNRPAPDSHHHHSS